MVIGEVIFEDDLAPHVGVVGPALQKDNQVWGFLVTALTGFEPVGHG
jgi:hypothetical protein